MMDYLSRTCLGFLIFIEIIKALKHLTFNYYVYMMRMTLNLAGHQMLSCTFVISIFIMAFASFQYLTLGPYLHLFKDMTSAIVTSIRIATAFVKMKIYVQTDFADTGLNKAMFVGFFFMVTLTLMDVFISIINNAIECVKTEKVSQSTKRRIYDSQLNQFFWRKVTEIFQFITNSSNIKNVDSSKTFERKFVWTSAYQLLQYCLLYKYVWMWVSFFKSRIFATDCIHIAKESYSYEHWVYRICRLMLPYFSIQALCVNLSNI